MTSEIISFLTYALPSGFIGAAVSWLLKRKSFRAHEAREVHDTYKAMYEDISRLLLETQRKYDESTKLTDKLVSEYNLTRRALNRLSRAVEAIQICPHRATCPVTDKLQDEGGSADGDESDIKRAAKRAKPKPQREGNGGKDDDHREE